MKKILLTKGKFALVDDEDFEWLNQWKWFYSSTGYAIRSQHISNQYKHKNLRMHVIINKTPKNLFTDHINRNKLDNRKCNLRSVTKSINGINRSKQKNNTSGYKGICFNKKAKKWMVEIKRKPLRKYIGLFKNLEEAIFARKQAEKIYHEI